MILQITNQVAPTNAVKAVFTLRVHANAANDIGAAWFRNALVEKTPSVGTYISSGVVNTGAVRVKSTGKNLLPLKPGSITLNGVTVTVDGDGYITLNGTSTAVTRYKITNGLDASASIPATWKSNNIMPLLNTAYTLQLSDVSGSTSSSSYPAFDIQDESDTTKTSLYPNSVNGRVTFTNTNSKTLSYLRIVVTSGITFTNYKCRLQLQYDSSNLSYEPYKECKVYVPAVGASIGTVKDETNVSSGEKKQGVSNSVALGDKDWVTCTNGNTTNYWIMMSVLPIVDFESSTASRLNNYAGGYKDYDTLIALDGYGYTIATGVNSRKLLIKIPKAEIVDAIDNAKTKAWLQSKTVSVTHQLATPVTSKIIPQTLVMYANGSIIVEPVIYEDNSYNNGITIKNTAYPIKYLDSVTKFNADKTQTIIDPSTCTIASDGLSFTCPTLVNGDDVLYTYYYDSAITTLATLKYSFNQNIRSVIDSNTRAIATQSEQLRKIIISQVW
jgi:hypothetical protein